jgi:glycosyltransferase involved in cell wall biosynthesis
LRPFLPAGQEIRAGLKTEYIPSPLESFKRALGPGHKTDFWTVIENRIRELGLTERIVFPGMAPQEDLDLIYRNAQFVILPTMFEAASAPLFEAWQRGVPVAISSIEPLTDQAAGSARLFDHFSVESIATTLLQMATDVDIRRELITRGHQRLADFSSERTAKTYRAIYRKVAGLVPRRSTLTSGESLTRTPQIFLHTS